MWMFQRFLVCEALNSVIELKLNSEERAAFMKSVDVVKAACGHLKTVTVS